MTDTPLTDEQRQKQISDVKDHILSYLVKKYCHNNFEMNGLEMSKALGSFQLDIDLQFKVNKETNTCIPYIGAKVTNIH